MSIIAVNKHMPALSLKTAAFSVLLLLVVLISACASVPPVFKIGLVGPFEGRHREIGYDVIYSARMAVREGNTRDDIGDYRVALVALDDFGDPQTAEEVARSLVIDPAVVAVVGHWLPKTTEAAARIYEDAGLPFIPAGAPPFGYQDPEHLPADFKDKYAVVTPFDEIAGPHAAAGYDAMNLILKAISEAENDGRTIDRKTIGDILTSLKHQGVTGDVFVPQ
jgi:ABC-type branched-subunit amino acid transport system substrate-binding protein